MGIGPVHLLVLAAIALLFFGPSKLPGLGKSMGEALKGFKDAMNDMNSEADKITKSVAEKPSTHQAPNAQHAIDAAIDVSDETGETGEAIRKSSTDSKLKS